MHGISTATHVNSKCSSCIIRRATSRSASPPGGVPVNDTPPAHARGKPAISRRSGLSRTTSNGLAVALFLGGCGGSSGGTSETCAQLLADFNAEKANALSCDPAAQSPCSGQAPVVVSVHQQDGETELEALAGNCSHSTNAARSASTAEPEHGQAAVVPYCLRPGQIRGLVSNSGELNLTA
jgi:hypothetical protein